jgi:hypothetical protein
LDAVRAVADPEERLAAVAAYIEAGEKRLVEAREMRVALVAELRGRRPPVTWLRLTELAKVGEGYLRRAR